MLKPFYHYFETLTRISKPLFLAVATLLVLGFLAILTSNPYKKTTHQTRKAVFSLKKQSHPYKTAYWKVPSAYLQGWQIYQRSLNLLPSECIFFESKKPRFLLDIILLLAVACTMPFCLLPLKTQIYDWQFFVPFAYLLSFLVLFQTHRLLFKKHTEKAFASYKKLVALLDDTYKRGYFCAKQRIANVTNPTVDGQSFANEDNPTENLSKINFLTKNGITKPSALSVCEALSHCPPTCNAKQQKQVNDLLNKAFYSLCKNKEKSI